MLTLKTRVETYVAIQSKIETVALKYVAQEMVRKLRESCINIASNNFRTYTHVHVFETTRNAFFTYNIETKLKKIKSYIMCMSLCISVFL